MKNRYNLIISIILIILAVVSLYDVFYWYHRLSIVEDRNIWWLIPSYILNFTFHIIVGWVSIVLFVIYINEFDDRIKK